MSEKIPEVDRYYVGTGKIQRIADLIKAKGPTPMLPDDWEDIRMVCLELLEANEALDAAREIIEDAAIQGVPWKEAHEWLEKYPD